MPDDFFTDADRERLERQARRFEERGKVQIDDDVEIDEDAMRQAMRDAIAAGEEWVEHVESLDALWDD